MENVLAGVSRSGLVEFIWEILYTLQLNIV